VFEKDSASVESKCVWIEPTAGWNSQDAPTRRDNCGIRRAGLRIVPIIRVRIIGLLTHGWTNSHTTDSTDADGKKEKDSRLKKFTMDDTLNDC